MDAFDYSAKWWLPEQSENQIDGVLSFSPADGLELVLNGSFKDFEEMLQVAKYPVILGFSNAVKEISLIDCYESGSKMSFPGYPTQKCRPSIALIGKHVPDFNEERYSTVLVQYSYLPEWTRLSGFSENYRIDREKKLENWNLRYAFPDKVACDIAQGKLSITFTFHQKKSDRFREFVVGQSTWVQIDFLEPRLYEEMLNQVIHPIQDLLTLATGKPNSIVATKIYSTEVEDSESTVKQRGIDVIYRQIATEDPDESPDPAEMIFTLDDIKDDLGNAIESWLKAHTELDSVCHLYFGVFYAPPTYLEERFLNLVYAAETYHRRRFNNQLLPDADHDKRIELVLESVPENYREWLGKKLKYSNEPTLRNRLDELLSLACPANAPLIKNKKIFINKIVDTRNYLIHHDVSSKQKAVTGTELLNLTKVVSYLVQTCLLTEVGFSKERCLDLVSRNDDFAYLAEILDG